MRSAWIVAHLSGCVRTVRTRSLGLVDLIGESCPLSAENHPSDSLSHGRSCPLRIQCFQSWFCDNLHVLNILGLSLLDVQATHCSHNFIIRTFYQVTVSCWWALGTMLRVAGTTLRSPMKGRMMMRTIAKVRSSRVRTRPFPPSTENTPH